MSVTTEINLVILLGLFILPNLFFTERFAQAAVCNGVTGIYKNEGFIESPGFSQSQNYPKDVTCKWLIYGPVGSTVTLEFESFSLEESIVCDVYDYVTLKERCTEQATISPNLGDRSDGYCGTDKPPKINTTCNEVLITFVSDDSKTEAGFRMKYKINKDPDTNAATAKASEKAVRSQQEGLKDMGNYTQDMETILFPTKRGHVKVMKSGIKHKKTAKKAINKSLQKTRNEKRIKKKAKKATKERAVLMIDQVST